MGVIGLLVGLHPRAWRERYGEEFTALLEDTPITAAVVLDVVLGALRAQMAAHRVALVVALGVAVSAACYATALVTGLSANILWAPTTPARALLLAGSVVPPVVLLVRFLHRTGRPETPP